MTAQDTIKMPKKTDRCFVGFSRLQLSTNDQAEVDLEIRLPKLESIQQILSVLSLDA